MQFAIKNEVVGNGRLLGDQRLQSNTIAQHHFVDPCLNKTYVSALPSEGNENVSPHWGSPAVLVRIRLQQRNVEVTWEGQELNSAPRPAALQGIVAAWQNSAEHVQ